MGKTIYLTDKELKYLLDLLQCQDMHDEEYEKAKSSLFAKVSK